MVEQRTITQLADPELTGEELNKKQIEKLFPVFTPIPLVKYPYFVSSTRRNRKKAIRYEEITRNKTKIEWSVISPIYLPGEMEFKVWCWILQKVSEMHKPIPPEFYIPYSLTEIARYWDMPTCGKTITLLAKAIDNLRRTNIHYWIQKSNKAPDDKAFSLLTSREGKGTYKNEKILNKNIIYLDPVVRRYLNEGPIKPAALELIKILVDTNLIAARLYELLSWRLYAIKNKREKPVVFLYSNLVKRLGLKEEKYESWIKAQFFKTHKCLKEHKVIDADPKWEAYQYDWDISYLPGKNLILEIEEWDRRKRLKWSVNNLEDKISEMTYALEEITNYVGKNETYAFQGLVKNVFRIHKNGMDIVFKAISETKQEEAGRKLKKNRAALLTFLLKKYI